MSVAVSRATGRATIASRLYNAPEGLSLLDLMARLGHTNPVSTQHYIRLTPDQDRDGQTQDRTEHATAWMTRVAGTACGL